MELHHRPVQHPRHAAPGKHRTQGARARTVAHRHALRRAGTGKRAAARVGEWGFAAAGQALTAGRRGQRRSFQPAPATGHRQGDRAGLYRSQAIVDATGLVGQLVRVGPWSAEVMLISDPAMRCRWKSCATSARTVAEGTGTADEMRLSLRRPRPM
ncbi:MAG: hypothetical protein IPG49_11595 [Proteobacteria bacterium]|nr:hypothetical protein [Pseudomonadota bacterium]